MCKMCFQEISPCFKQNRNDEIPRLYVQEHSMLNRKAVHYFYAGFLIFSHFQTCPTDHL